LCFSISSKMKEGNRNVPVESKIIFLVKESFINAEKSTLESMTMFNPGTSWWLML
jgi:hypothetical protein